MEELPFGAPAAKRTPENCLAGNNSPRGDLALQLFGRTGTAAPTPRIASLLPATGHQQRHRDDDDNECDDGLEFRRHESKAERAPALVHQ